MFIIAKHKAGLEKSQEFENSDSFSDVASISSSRQRQSSYQLEQISKNQHLLQQANEEYLSKFKYICKLMEQKFFKEEHETTFIFSDRASCFDHILYQELVTAMIISGHGNAQEMFSSDASFRLYDIKNLSKWFNRMGHLE